MRLIIAIVDDKDVDKVMAALTEQHIGVTRVSSSGGLLNPGNSTLLIGLDEENVPQAMQIITELAAPRQAFVPFAAGVIDMSLASFVEVPVGGYMTFVLDIDHFEQV